MNSLKTITAALLALPLLVSCAAPKLDFTTREQAFAHCQAELDEAIREINSGAEGWDIVKSDEYAKRTITQSYCEPERNADHREQGYVIGYIEWLEQDLQIVSATRVEKVIASYATSYPWGS